MRVYFEIERRKVRAAHMPLITNAFISTQINYSSHKNEKKNTFGARTNYVCA